jgi:hypothetical protein
MEGYSNRICDAYDRIVQTTVMIVAMGTFTLIYNNANDFKRNNTNTKNSRPNIEAILVKEEKLHSYVVSEKVPGNRNRFNGWNENKPFNSYNGKRNV